VAYDQIFISQTVAGLLIWDALSDERTGLMFTLAAGRLVLWLQLLGGRHIEYFSFKKSFLCNLQFVAVVISFQQCKSET
jgi:hypothetical protein